MFTKIDETQRSDHFYLTPNDDCYFYGEYSSGRGFSHSKTNSFISNLKKEVQRKGLKDWPYKEKAIREASNILKIHIKREWIFNVTFIPVPPSKIKNDPCYDDRLVRILHGIYQDEKIDIREVIVQNTNRDSMHSSGHRYTPEQLATMYSIDHSLVFPSPTCIAIFDDVLTSGTHFKAIKSMIEPVFPGTPIVGIFLARRVPQNPTEQFSFDAFPQS